MQTVDVQTFVLLALIIFAWLTRRRGLSAINKLTAEQRNIYFKQFSKWRWRHYGMLFVLTALPGFLYWKPETIKAIAIGISALAIILNLGWFGIGYNIMNKRLAQLIDDSEFIKLHFSDRLSLCLLYLFFTIIAMQKTGIIGDYSM